MAALIETIVHAAVLVACRQFRPDENSLVCSQKDHDSSRDRVRFTCFGSSGSVIEMNICAQLYKVHKC